MLGRFAKLYYSFIFFVAFEVFNITYDYTECIFPYGDYKFSSDNKINQFKI